MGRKGYGPDVKLRAKALWIAGQKSDVEIAEELGIARPGTISDWRREMGWDREREVFQQMVEERVSKAVAETVNAMNLRHLKEYQLLQAKGVQGLKVHDPKTAHEAMAMLDIGIKGERLVRGEPTEVREVRALMQTNVQILELVVADVLKVLIEQGKLDNRVTKQFADLFANRVNQAEFRYAVEG